MGKGQKERESFKQTLLSTEPDMGSYPRTSGAIT